MEPILLGVLTAIAFVGGVLVTAVGPGGIFVVAALYGLTTLSEAVVAGTASVTFVGGSALGAAGYASSDDIDWALAVPIGVGGALGTQVGVALNAAVSRRLFGLLLGALLGVVGLTIVRSERGYLDRGGGSRGPDAGLGGPGAGVAPASLAGIAVFGTIGLAIGTAGGLFGIGGAALVPPALVLAGIPMIAALAATQVAVVFIASAAAISYTFDGAIAVPLVFAVAGAYLVGAFGGWRLAKRVDPSRLTLALGLTLLGLVPVLVYRSLTL
jgi:uncharacterized membrane protein YfcA